MAKIWYNVLRYFFFPDSKLETRNLLLTFLFVRAPRSFVNSFSRFDGFIWKMVDGLDVYSHRQNSDKLSLDVFIIIIV